MAKDIIMACLFILAILFEVAETESIEQATQTHGYASHNITCQFNVLNLDQVKQQFFDFVSVDKASLVFFNIEINPEFLNITSYDNIHENGILRWLWVADSQLYILSYPIDLDGITLQLTKSAERTVHLAVNATIDYQEHDASSYTICMQSLYLTIFGQILDRNETDWKFCHRYFEGQYWKKVLYFLMGSWLGYDFQCFNAICADIKCADVVKKGTVNIIIDICILLLCLNLPLFYLFLPKRQNTSSNNVMHYHKGESPYGFARFFLHLNKNTQALNVNKRQQRKKFPEWMTAYLNNSSNLKPEARILSFICLILLGIYILENIYLRQAIADFDKYTEIYHPYYFSLEDAKIIKLKHSLKGEKKLKKMNDMEDITDNRVHNNIDVSNDYRQDIQTFYDRPDDEDAYLPVELFDQIAKEFVPLNVQVFILFLKVFFTGLFLYVTLDSLSNGGSDDFLTSQIPLIITVILPAIAERLCSPSNIKDVVKMNEDAIKHMIENFKPNCDENPNEPSTITQPTGKTNFCTLLVIFCPIVYAMKNIITYPFICCSKQAKKIDVSYCPEDLQYCKCACCVIEENDETEPINGDRDRNNYNSTVNVVTHQPN
ncbi:unnamed protein product [Mytilus coruscus]|uniref:Uncharacterized protein n=1 Tax=Mytilus coruscus TaxID=42192 RepID=A0A6J8DLG6_MYTCO|nr:unnamed protein product [Mytilus coruscus]